MTVDEIVAHYVRANRLTHPEDIANTREVVEEVAAMLEQPRRWTDDKPTPNASASTT